MFDVKQYRGKESEVQRVESVMRMLPEGAVNVLEAGCRDGYITLKLAAKYPAVTALDLKLPQIDHPNVTCVKGDITSLPFKDNSFDLTVCTEVLEHIPPEKLGKACRELMRVSRRYLLIGVPYKQDLRVHAMKCIHCGTINPTTGHVNTFDEDLLKTLFNGMPFGTVEYPGTGVYKTNRLSYAIYKRYGFPYGSYQQEEPCIYCGLPLKKPHLNVVARLICLFAKGLEFLQNKTGPSKSPVWIHILWDTTRRDS
ncbi:MAG TPA: methyltransferase domain-containing protein [Bacteroidales bacterium]|nr:methyltransferase domain-containing protein [Bacteroidales bacterium]HPQ56288.1 methyltransferase domain-containing protein [Bacteroidales bacterium]